MAIELLSLLGFTAILLMTIMAQSMAFTARFGLGATLQSRDVVGDESRASLRLQRATRNSLEAMALFLPLAFVANALSISNTYTVTASLVFLGARAVYPILYAIGAVPFRTMSWSISVFALMVFAYGILTGTGSLV